MAAAEDRWHEVSSVSREQLEETFASAINRSMELHRQHLLSAEEAAAERTHLRWSGVQTALESCAAGSKSLQADMARQAESLFRIVDATGHVRTLEDSLNRNLTSLSAAQHLQETLLNLSAAVNLLNARLERIAPAPSYLGHSATVASKAA
jgi:hypothetical protein